ncbi:hypothetical protein GCM10009733_006810 [Nonomuraea maheshkhaliensis]|uniref:DNA-binding phage zinc finger domain-containing protein n=1 Tax=Nonomuraea maheshkhaliensis TaxID=419590 RepID=A0ABN2EP18_9ACTN
MTDHTTATISGRDNEANPLIPQDPHTRYLFHGDRITLDELAVHLNAASIWLRDLAIAAERPDTPIELGDNVCQRLATLSDELAQLGEDIAEADTIISEHRPLKPHLSMHKREPWGSRAHGEDPATWGKRLSTVLSLRQILMLARQDHEPWGNQEAGIAYWDGIKDLPGIEDWVSKRAADRLAQARTTAIQAQAQRERCDTCQAPAGVLCRTKNGHVAESFHKPRLKAATVVVDEALAEGSSNA